MAAPGVLPSQHARLAPSSSERWLSCPASVRVVDALGPDAGFNDSPYAREGTVAHALGELEASRTFGKITDKAYLLAHRRWRKDALSSGLSEEQLGDMVEHIEGYVDLIRERLTIHPYSQLLLEQSMPTGVPSSWGTSDTVIVSPTHVEIIDLKYGQGVAVGAEANPQLRLYALGALDVFGDILGETESVRMTIFQPRLHSTSASEMTADELRAWRRLILPIAASALDGTGDFGPSDEACRWCPASGQCRAQLEWATQRDFGEDPDLLSPAELAEVLALMPGVKQWAAAVEETALRKAYSEGVPLPGYKVVMSGGIRVIEDKDAAIQAFQLRGFSLDQLLTDPKLRGLGDLEGLLKTLPKVKPEGATRPRYLLLEDVLETIGRTPGRPSLVGEADPRPAVEPNTEAVKEFTP